MTILDQKHVKSNKNLKTKVDKSTFTLSECGFAPTGVTSRDRTNQPLNGVEVISDCHSDL